MKRCKHGNTSGRDCVECVSPAPEPKKVWYDPIDDINRWESGEMEESEAIEFFQRLINTGLCWQLQGCYGRQAKAFIDAGKCSLPAKIRQQALTEK